jgi:quercetin dioxygenase-like cupin family protein
MKWLAIILLTLAAPRTAAALEANASMKVTQTLKTSASWNGAPITYPTGKPEVTGLRIELAPGGETGWHQHPVPSFAYVLEGTLEVALQDGRVKRFEAGDAFAEVTNTLHNGRNVGKTPVKLIVFYAGAEGQALSVKKP